MKWKTIVLLVLSAFLILGCVSDPSAILVPAPVATAEPPATVFAADSEQPFVIGAMESLTGIGETYGNALIKAKLLAIEEINAAGGINGRQVMLIVEDSKCNAEDAIVAYNKLTDVEGVKIILGPTCSGSMLGVAPFAEKEGVILFSASTTNPDIAFAGD